MDWFGLGGTLEPISSIIRHGQNTFQYPRLLQPSHGHLQE